jgi:DnaJ-domain-containing protein 1
MISYVLLGIALLLSLLLVARGLAGMDTRALVKGVRYGGGAAAAGLAVYLIVSGRWPYAIAAVTTALPFIMRWRLMRDRWRTTGRTSEGRRSEVETAMLRMSLDLGTGAMSGTVLKGKRAGRDLDGLSLSELVAFLDECRTEDPQSVQLLESYLDRRFGGDWRARAEEPAGGGARHRARERPKPSDAMTRSEALAILGLVEGATPDQIKEAYRRLMIKLHPDAGGSVYLAAKLNQAKDLLLGNH